MLVFLFLLALLSPPTLTATWQGDDRLEVTWAGAPAWAQLYIQQPGYAPAPIPGAFGPEGSVSLAPGGGDGRYSVHPGDRLFIGVNLADGALVEARVPWRVTFPLVTGAP